MGGATVCEENAPTDIDNDSLPDWWELANFGNLLQGPTDDPDEDTLTNLDEFLGIDGVGQTETLTGDPAWGLGDGTDPTDDDTDGDGIPDGSEVRVYHTKPYAADTDDDSFSDLAEITAGTLPDYPLDPYKHRSVRLDGDAGSLLRVAAQSGHALPVFTVELWFKRGSVAQDGEELLLSRTAGAGANFELGIDASYRPFGRFTYNHGSAVKTVTSPAPINAATDWHHIALVYDSVDTGVMDLYVDGVRKDTAYAWISPDMDLGDLLIGSDGVHGFDGAIDEVRIWREARSASEITTNMRRQMSGSESDLVSYYRMDDDEWGGSDKSPVVFGAQDFVSNKLGDSARGEGGYAFVPDVPDLILIDSDGDGLPDDWEIANGLSPFDDTGDNGADGDPDNDGLTNLGEYENGTRAQEADTDSDGMADGWEVDNGLNPLADDAAADPDGDGLANIEEYLGADFVVDLTVVPPDWGDATDPQNSDTDGDGLPDGWERQYDLDATSDADDDGADGDPDGDGLTNIEERDYLTDPRDYDTDNDSLPDGWEVANGLHPLDPTGVNGAHGDPDNDGADNIVEFGQGTDPNNRDTDGDDLPDGWEIRYDLNPLSALPPNGRDDDPDLDGRTNYEEFLAGTNPKVPEDDSLDSDGDGLTDVEEWQSDVSTDPHQVDTDDDGDNDYVEYQVGTEGYNSLSKESISTYVDLKHTDKLDYRGNLVARLDEDEYLSVPRSSGADQRLAFSSWTVEARFRFRLGTTERGYLDLDALDVGDELFLVRRAFEEPAPSGNLDINYAIGLKVGHRSDGTAFLYPFATWNNTNDEDPARAMLRTVQVSDKNLKEGQWYHLAASYNAVARTFELYLDGKVVARQVAVTGFCPSVVPDKTPFVRIGEGYAGDIDEVRIWGVPERTIQIDDAGVLRYVNGFVRDADAIAYGSTRSVMPTIGIFDPGLALEYAIPQTGTSVDYNVDIPIPDGNWETPAGTQGVPLSGVFYEELPPSGLPDEVPGAWDPNEAIWVDVDQADDGTGNIVLGTRGLYDPGVDIVIYGTPTAAAETDPTVVFPLVGSYNDVNHNLAWDPDEDIWLEYTNKASWYDAQESPWAKAMGLALYLKFDDAGKSIEDFAWHADWRAFWSHAIRPETTGLTMDMVVYDGNDQPSSPHVAIDPPADPNTGTVARDAMLQARIDLPSVDPEGGTVEYTYQWFLGLQAPVDPDAPFLSVDSNDNGRWDVGEPIFNDVDNDGVMDAGEQVVGADTPVATGMMLDLADVGAVAGQTYYLVVVPVDELGKAGDPAVAFANVSDRTSPTRPALLETAPELAWQGDDLVVRLRNVSGQRVSLMVEWYRNFEFFAASDSVMVQSADDPLTDDVIESDAEFVLDGSFVLDGDAWSFMAYAIDDDGGRSRPTYGPGDPQVRTPWIVGGGAGGASENLPPSQPTEVKVVPTNPIEEDMLFCEVDGSVDPEGDAFTYVYQWYRVDVLTGEYVPALLQTTPIVSETLTLAGDRWYCKVYAVDVYGNRSVAISSNPILIRAAPGGVRPYEPNDSPAEAHRILPKLDPMDLADPNIQEQSFDANDDVDWYWFLVEDGPGYEEVKVTFETNDGTEMWNQYHRSELDFTDTVLALYQAGDNGNLRFLRQVDDVGVPGELGGSRFARVEMDLEPGIYYVQVWTLQPVTPGVINSDYTAHLWFETPAGATGPSEPTSVVVTPESPTASMDLVCDAGGAVSPLGEGEIHYAYVWFRRIPGDLIPQVVPFGGGTQPYEGRNYILSNAKPDISPDGSPANVVPARYTREGEMWSCMVFAVDANGESAGVISNEVTIGSSAWVQNIMVDKTYTDGTEAQTQTVTVGWLFGATHGFDLDMDAELPGDPDGPPNGMGDTGGAGTTAAGSSFSIGIQPEHSRLSVDMRPYGALTSWYIKVQLGRNPASCRLRWDDVQAVVADMPLSITRVQEGPYGEFYPVQGTTLDMSEFHQIIISQEEIDQLIAEHGDEPEKMAVVFRVSLGTGGGSQTLHLEYGWNMVSFGVTPVNPSVDSVFAFNGQQVIAGVPWAYEGGAYVPAVTVKPTVGYWVFCPFEEGATFTVHGIRTNANINLEEGWNLVGPVYETNVLETYEQYGTGPNGNGAVELDSLMGLDPGRGEYFNTDVMKPGLGYWIKANRNVELPADVLKP